ncbi:hypothetical protein DICPUDRAFT_24979 [Dictyostelium purpureum]|uniref:Uncharacterized protein n=2 Tax=Dictyostelium purpureum TaxID=5786 RepID=F0Z661_DICPU|nr:uncharacterized protein DICPUDRAFT_24979 [Dictyostelium purpureum]EGC40599.1 hypothetical protein DICPUDRAFT_24979 [Dictyostelium purpureum]|eukprot:XP_003282935.1 hypothetical protein DICPUDRAFT_24979 [Dictyostelium purpureum]
MPLSLTSRKSLKDNEETFKTHLATIEKALGEPFEIVFDFEDIITKCNDNWVTNSCGSIFYKDVVGNLAKNIDTKVSKNEMVKEAFLAAVPNKKIVFVAADEKLPSYWQYSFADGNCVVSFRPKICNTNDVFTAKLETLLPSQGTYSLMTRLNIKENQAKMDANLAAVKKAMKSDADWTIDQSSLEAVYPHVADDLKNSFGHIFAGVVEKVAANLAKRCADEMVLEAVQEATSNRTIVIKHNATQNGYWLWSFESGNLVISFKSITNTNDVQTFDFIKLL